MAYLIVGLFILLLTLIVLRSFLQTSPTSLARLVRIAGGTATAGLAFVSLVRGQYFLALALFFAALELATNMGLSGRLAGRKTPGQTSRVATPMVEIELDHDSGAIRGRVLMGAFKDRPLESMTCAELMALRAECAPGDAESAALIEAYLDRVAPDWRTTGGGEQPEPERPSTPGTQPMSRADAYRVLGLEPGVTDEQIRAAWRELMKRNHPDQGGSAELAALINRAKETLLRE